MSRDLVPGTGRSTTSRCELGFNTCSGQIGWQPVPTGWRSGLGKTC